MLLHAAAASAKPFVAIERPPQRLHVPWPLSRQRRPNYPTWLVPIRTDGSAGFVQAFLGAVQHLSRFLGCNNSVHLKTILSIDRNRLFNATASPPNGNRQEVTASCAKQSNLMQNWKKLRYALVDTLVLLYIGVSCAII